MKLVEVVGCWKRLTETQHLVLIYSEVNSAGLVRKDFTPTRKAPRSSQHFNVRDVKT